MQTLFYVTLLVFATSAWGYLFYKKDYHPQPLRVIAQSFVIGLFAMVPIFAYKAIYQRFLPALAEYQIFQPLLNSTLLSGTSVFILNLIVLSLVLFVLSGITSVILNFFSLASLTNFKEALKEEPLGFTVVSLLLGFAIYVETFTQNILGNPAVGALLGSILFLAIIEEYIKHLMVRVADDKKLKDIDDAITLSIIVGLAFAFVETLVYSVMVGEMKIIFYRILISIPVHVVASGIFGYYYGLSHFAKNIVKIEGGEKIYGKKWLPKILSFKRSTLYHEEKLIEGIFFATTFHAAMNLLFEFSLGFIAVPFIIIGLVLLSRLYKLGEYESKLLLATVKQKNRLLKGGLKNKTMKV